MASKDDNMIVASTDVDAALATPTVIDSDEFDKARLDRRWRDFCLNADHYVVETTRPGRYVDRAV